MSAEIRSFPAFPPGRRPTSRGRGRSWWGDAWLAALEATSLDADQLRRGRIAATGGMVGSITVSAGRVQAVVHDADGSAQEAVVNVPTFDEPTWARVDSQVAGRAGNVAALLAGELPRELAEDAEIAGVALLPELGDLDPSCTCDGWELPCRHAAALCYQVARLLDDDPFLVLLLRGRGREAFVGTVDAIASAPPVTADDTIPTAVAAPAADDPRDKALRLLVSDAARRARAVLATADPDRSALNLDPDADAERWATWYGSETSAARAT